MTDRKRQLVRLRRPARLATGGCGARFAQSRGVPWLGVLVAVSSGVIGGALFGICGN